MSCLCPAQSTLTRKREAGNARLAWREQFARLMARKRFVCLARLALELPTSTLSRSHVLLVRNAQTARLCRIAMRATIQQKVKLFVIFARSVTNVQRRIIQRCHVSMASTRTSKDRQCVLPAPKAKYAPTKTSPHRAVHRDSTPQLLASWPV